MSGSDFLVWELRSKEYVPMACAKLYKTKLLRENKGFVPGLISEDEEFTPRIYLQAKKVSRCNICWYIYIGGEMAVLFLQAIIIKNG